MTPTTSGGALLIALDGTVTLLTFQDGSAAQIAADHRLDYAITLDAHLDIWIETQFITSWMCEGHNPLASAFAAHHGWDYEIHGVAMVAASSHGDIAPLTPELVDACTVKLDALRTSLSL